MPGDPHTEGAASVSPFGESAGSATERARRPAKIMEEPDWARAVTRLCARSAAADPPGGGRVVGGPPGGGRVDSDRVDSGRVVGLRLEAERLVALARAELPPPFTRDEGSWLAEGFTAWAMPRREDSLPLRSRASTGDGGRDTSAFVTVARQANTRTLVDLAALKSTAVDGPPVAVGAALSEIVVELATRRWSDLGELLLVGFGRDLERLVGTRFLANMHEAREALSERPGSSSLFGLDEDDADACPAGRTSRCFVVAPGLPGTGNHLMLADFIARAEQAPRTAVVCCDVTAPVRAVWQLSAHRQPRLVEIRRRGRVVGAIPLSDAVTAQLASRRSASATRRRSDDDEATLGGSVQPGPLRRAPAAARRAFPPALRATPSPSGRGRSPDASAPICAGIRVNVLGPVEVRGTADDIRRRRTAVELIAYLAVHPEGVLGEVLAAALWPAKRIPAQSFANRLHEARTLLGRTPAGASRLARRGGLHLLGEDVSCDWTEFRALTAAGSGTAEWRHALELVRGRPLQGLAGGDWAMLEGFNATIEGAIVDTAVNLSEALLEVSDTIGSEWAARRGLVVAPWDERLYRLLMRAADRSGNRMGVEAVLTSLALALDIRGDPLAAVHPATSELYRRLMTQYRAGESAAQ